MARQTLQPFRFQTSYKKSRYHVDYIEKYRLEQTRAGGPRHFEKQIKNTIDFRKLVLIHSLEINLINNFLKTSERRLIIKFNNAFDVPHIKVKLFKRTTKKDG